MISNSKKTYVGIDLLKFIMALAVVAIHVKPFETRTVLSSVFKPWTSVAVPVFFLISAFLFFSKIERVKVGGENNEWVTVAAFAKRIGVLYLVWFIIDLPYIISIKGYFTTYGFWETIGRFIKDLFLGTTYPGSWFLSALVVSVVVVFVLSRVIGKWLTFGISMLISVYVMSQSWLPESMHGLYDWYAAFARKEVMCSFPFALIWVSMGQLMASERFRNTIETMSKRHKILLWLGVAVLYSVMALIKEGSWYVDYLLVPLVFVAALMANIKPSATYKFLRESSILIFLFHFSIAGKKSLFLNLIGQTSLLYHILFYLLVVLVSFAFATVVLLLEKRKHLTFLKYTH